MLRSTPILKIKAFNSVSDVIPRQNAFNYLNVDNQVLHMNTKNVIYLKDQIQQFQNRQKEERALNNHNMLWGGGHILNASIVGASTKLRATSHTRLRACDHYTSNTLVGGKGGAGLSLLLHTTLEGPAEYMNIQDECKVYMDWIPPGIVSTMFHGHLDYFHKPSLGGRPNTNP